MKKKIGKIINALRLEVDSEIMDDVEKRIMEIIDEDEIMIRKQLRELANYIYDEFIKATNGEVGYVDPLQALKYLFR